MPLITVQYSTPRPSPSLKTEIAAAVSRLSSDVLHKDPKVTAIVIQEVDASDWFVGGRPLAKQNLASVWLDIHITDGTNTKDEKAAFVAATFRRFGELLGQLHEESYVHVHEVRADAYGYGGLTQERRYIAGKLSAAHQGNAA